MNQHCKLKFDFPFLFNIQVDIQTALSSLFPEDFSTRVQSQQIDQNPPTSSSSSLRSISTGSPEYSSLIFSIPGTSQPHFPPETLGASSSRVVPTMQPVPNSPHQPPSRASPNTLWNYFPSYNDTNTHDQPIPNKS